ncbi:MAG: sle [Microbacteriaceae bacterium]|nr:sle [Microbacteriaceae bacterium]
MTDERAVLTEKRGHVFLITLNRPAVLNAINQVEMDQLVDALDEFSAEPQLRVAVISGAGRAFCAGMDVSAFGEGAIELSEESGFNRLARHPVDKPLIAAVHGVAFGGGAEIAFSCDIIVADETARFALPEVTLGIIAGGGGVLRAARALPAKIAAEFALTGAPMQAADAARWGMVNRLVPAGTAVDAAIELAERIAANAPLAVRASKRLLRVSAEGDGETDEGWAANQREVEAITGSNDAAEGFTAFLAKRPPEWTAT